ncbi:thermonuclease family protein [Marinococcus halophilus]|uniref:thermonuclease family protein n=1 Tax=Marinococcus halophilus TaxID=1371 RepID=UPI0009A650EF|nr:thermonuclease family protein [Marinococcus halophilus]
METKKKWYRRIPGFRSGKKRKMIIASFFYLMVLLGLTGNLEEEPANPQTASQSAESAQEEEQAVEEQKDQEEKLAQKKQELEKKEEKLAEQEDKLKQEEKDAQQDEENQKDQSSEAQNTSNSEDNEQSSEQSNEADANSEKKTDNTNASVTNVVDGDTIDVNYKDTEERVRLILVDTPETKHPNKGVQPYGPEASEYTTETLDGEKVRLEIGEEKRDQYDRLLAYVYIDGENFNETLLRDGYARLSVYPPNTKYQNSFEDAQSKAQAEDLRIWSEDNYVTDEGFRTTSSSEEQSEEDSSSNEESSDSSSSVSTDMDCADFSSQSEVEEFWDDNDYGANNDPHNLDGESDGDPCESYFDTSSEPAEDSSDSSSESVYYENCTAAREAGAAPVQEGDPGYGSHLDRDDDGTGCE